MLTTRAASAANHQPLSAIGCPAFCPLLVMASAATSGSAQITGQTPKHGGAAPATQLLIRREILAADLREARRKHRSTSDILARLQAATNLTLSRRGCGDQQHIEPGA